MPERPTEPMIVAVARRRYQRAHPWAPAHTWDWLPPAVQGPWLHEARADLEAAFAAVTEEDGA